MNILFYGPRVSPHVTRPLIAMQDRGHNVFPLDRSFIGEDDSSTLPFEWVPMPRDRNSQKRIIAEIGRKFQPDVLHLHWADSLAGNCLSAAVAPLVVSVWGSDVNRPVALNSQGFPSRAISENSRYFDYKMHLNLMPQFAAIIVDDPVMVAKCRFLCGEEVPIHNIHLGADDDFFVPVKQEDIDLARERFGLTENEKLILSPRAFEPRYGHMEILEAFAQLDMPNALLGFKLYRGHDPNAPGYGDPYTIRGDATSIGTSMHKTLQEFELAIRNRAEQLGVGGKIRFINNLDRSLLPLCLAMSDVIVNSPVIDGFPITFIEAAALGVMFQ